MCASLEICTNCPNEGQLCTNPYDGPCDVALDFQAGSWDRLEVELFNSTCEDYHG